MLNYVRKKIGLKLFFIFSGLMFSSVGLIIIYHQLETKNFNQQIVAKNEQYVTNQSLQVLTTVTAERANKTDAILQKLSAHTGLIAKDAELRLSFAKKSNKSSIDVASQLKLQPENSIFFSPLSAELALMYWGGDTITPEVATQINLLANLAPTLALVKESSPIIAASHLIMASGVAAYYPNNEKILKLPPVSVFDIRTTNNFVMANPVNNPEAKPLWVPVYFDDAGNGLVTSVTAPIYGDQGTFLGVAGLDVPIDRLRRLVVNDTDGLEPNKLHAHELVMLLNEKGNIISFPLDKLKNLGIESKHVEFQNAGDVLNLRLIDSSMPEIRSLGEDLLRSPNFTTELRLHDENYIVSSRQLPTNGWTLIIFVPEQDFLTPVQSITSAITDEFTELRVEFTLAAILLFLAMLIITVFMLKRVFLGPIEHVTSAAQQISEGDLDATVEIKSTDELGQLAKHFNLMVEALKKSRNLEQNYAKELQLQVDKQTEEIQEKQFLLEQALQELQVDIERRQNVEDELVLAKDAAESANQAKANFLANMTHELRTPLIGVLGMNELLLDTPLSEHQRSLALTVQQSGESLLELVNDILDFSKIETGLMKLKPANCMFDNTFKIVEELLTETACGKGLSLSFEIDPAARVSVFCDPQRLQQILVNLVGNAIKFTHQGGVIVRVGMKSRENDSGHFVIEVEDTGIGIKPEEQEAIFSPFVQVDSTSSRAFGGTGLGLTIVRELIEAMKGSLTVESRPGDGSLFKIELELPIVKTAKIVPASYSEPFDEDRNQFIGKILVVDDYDPTHKLIQNFLTETNLEIDLVSSAGKALQCVERGNYNLILMDCNMPDTDGIEATRQLRTRGFNAPIIAMTAHVDSRILEACQEAGMNDHLRKPFQRKDLFRILKKYLLRQ